MEEPVKKRRYRKGVSKAIIENAKAANPLSYVELAAAIGCRPNTIYRSAARLRSQGRIPNRYGVTAPPPSDTGGGEPAPSNGAPPDLLDVPPSKWDENTLAAIDKLPKLNAEQRKKLLSAIAMRPSAGVGQAAAIKTLEDIDKGSGTQIGPPPPLTEVQQIERLSRLMQAVGTVVAQKAMEAAFGQRNPPKDPSPTQDSQPADSQSDMG